MVDPRVFRGVRCTQWCLSRLQTRDCSVLVNTLQFHDTVDFVQDSETEDPLLVAEPGVGRNHGEAVGTS